MPKLNFNVSAHHLPYFLLFGQEPQCPESSKLRVEQSVSGERVASDSDMSLSKASPSGADSLKKQLEGIRVPDKSSIMQSKGQWQGNPSFTFTQEECGSALQVQDEEWPYWLRWRGERITNSGCDRTGSNL